jgi:hypothetical protein
MLRASLISTIMGDERGRSATCPSYLLGRGCLAARAAKPRGLASLAPHIGERLTSGDVKALVASLAEKTSAPLDAHSGAETSAHTGL